MAKLVAMFDMKDNISRKLKGLYTGLEKVETATTAASKAVDKLDKTKARPTLTVIDTATGTVRTVQGNIDRLHKTKAKPTIAVDDKATPVTDSVNKKLDNIDGTKATATVTADDQATSVIENIQTKLDALRGTAIAIGAAGGISGASILGGGSSSMTIDARTSAATGINAAQVKKMVNQIYYDRMVGNTRADVAASVRDLAQQTNLRGGRLKTAATVSNQLAMIHEKDIPEVNRAISSMVNNFGVGSRRAGDNIAYIFKHAGDQYDDLLDTFNEYSSSFKDMKLTPEQISAAFVAGTKGGARNFDDMADAVREFNIRRMEATDDQIAAFRKALGPAETRKMFKGFKEGAYTGQEALYKLAHGLSKIKDESKRAQIATTLIGTKYEDMKKPILDMAAAIDEPVKATGELNKQFKNFDDQPFRTVEETGRKLEQTMSGIGSTIIAEVAPSFEKLNKWLDSKEGKAAVEDMTKTISDFASVFGNVLAPALQYGIENFNWLAPTIGAVTIGLGALTIGALAVVPALRNLKGAWDFIKPGKSKNIDVVTDSIDRMGRKSKKSAKNVETLTRKTKDMYKLKPPADHPLFGNDTRMGRKNNTRSGRKGKWGGIAKGAGKAVLPLGIGLGAYEILSAPAGERGQAVGGTLGGLGGGLAGATLGSVVPGIGTVIGGLAGGALGYLGGGKIGDWLGGLFGGGKQSPSGAGNAEAQGKKFGESFMKGLNSTSTSVYSWLSNKVYKPVGSSVKNAQHLGYAFSYSFVTGLNSAPISVQTWVMDRIYQPVGNAVVSAQHLGYSFSYNFVTGLNSAPVNVSGWVIDKIYKPLGYATKSAQHLGYAFAYNFATGLRNSPLTISTWIINNIYKPLGQASMGAKTYGASLVYNFKNGIKSVPVGMKTWLHNHVAQPMFKFIPSGNGFGQGFVSHFITGMRFKKKDVSAEARALAKAVDSAFRNELGIASPAKRMVENGYWSAMGVVKGFDSVDVSKIARSKAKDLMSSFGNFSGGGAAMARSAIMQALKITGMPMSWLNPLMMVAKHESGFNPNAINDWDINARRGDPSVGLFQIIGETFRRWTLPGFNNRRNPLHSAVAAIRYINGRYGGIHNHPGVKSKARGGGYKPYAKGGVITRDHIARVGEGNKREVIIPLEQHRNRALGLLDYAQKALGVAPQPALSGAASAPVVLPKEQTQTVHNIMSRPMQTVKQGIRDVIVQITGDSHYHNDMDAEKIGKVAVKVVAEHLMEEYFAGGEMVVDD